MKKIKIAFIKYAGLSAGGTEKFLQTIAAHLNKDIFEVDYYYTESVQYIGANHKQSGTNVERMKYMQTNNVNLIKVHLDAVNLKTRTHEWVNTNLFDIFDESKYDIVQTGRAGHPEFPFTKIHKTPIVDSLHLLAGVDNQYNISRVMHITDWSRKIWEFKGGDPNRSVLVSHPIEIQTQDYKSLRDELHLRDKLIFGFHQRDADSIFSPIQLNAYKKIENEHTHFIVLGGSPLYKKQASDLDIQHITFLEHTGDPKKIYSFLCTLDIYAHGRKDGEVNSTAMAEALYFGLPIISHTSDLNNGHIECIGNAGFVAKDVDEYTNILKRCLDDISYRAELSKNAKNRFNEMYELKSQIQRIEHVYLDVVKNPFPHPILRYIRSFRLRRFFIYFPYKITVLLFKYIHDIIRK